MIILNNNISTDWGSVSFVEFINGQRVFFKPKNTPFDSFCFPYYNDNLFTVNGLKYFRDKVSRIFFSNEFRDVVTINSYFLAGFYRLFAVNISGLVGVTSIKAPFLYSMQYLSFVNFGVIKANAIEVANDVLSVSVNNGIYLGLNIFGSDAAAIVLSLPNLNGNPYFRNLINGEKIIISPT